jgi:hypothetical protein
LKAGARANAGGQNDIEMVQLETARGAFAAGVPLNELAPLAIATIKKLLFVSFF